MSDPDSTLALLNSDLPSAGGGATWNSKKNKEVLPLDLDSDSDEEVILLGPNKKDKSSSNPHRKTLSREDLASIKRRSFEVETMKEEVLPFTSQKENQQETSSGWRQRRTVFAIDAPEGNNDEEEKEDSSASILKMLEEELNDKMDKKKKGSFSVAEAIVEPFKELGINKGSSLSPDRTDRSRSPLTFADRTSFSRRLHAQQQQQQSAQDVSLQSIDEDRAVEVFAPETTNEESGSYVGATRVSETPPRKAGYCPVTEDISSAEVSPEKANADSSLNSSTQSQWFNNTHDELVLYEKYGDDYETVLRGMNTKQKRQLKKVVSRTEAKSAAELLGDEADTSTDLTFHSNVDDDDADNIMTKDDVTESFIERRRYEEIKVRASKQQEELLTPTPKPRTKVESSSPEKKEKKEEEWSPRLVQSAAALQMLRDDLALALSPNPYAKDSAPKTKKKAVSLAGTSPSKDAVIKSLRGDKARSPTGLPPSRATPPMAKSPMARSPMANSPEEAKPQQQQLRPLIKATPTAQARTLTRATPKAAPLGAPGSKRATPMMATPSAPGSKRATPMMVKGTPGKFKTPLSGATPQAQPGSAGYRTPIPKGKTATPLYSNPRKLATTTASHLSNPRSNGKNKCGSNAHTPSYLRPTSAFKHRCPKKDPVTNETLDVTLCNRHGHTESAPVEPFHHRKLPPSLAMKNIVSPVSQYIRRNPARQVIRASPMRQFHHEEEEIEEEDDLNEQIRQ